MFFFKRSPSVSIIYTIINQTICRASGVDYDGLAVCVFVYLMGAWMILLSRLWCRLVAAERPRNSTVREVMRHNVIPAAHRVMNTGR